MKITNDCLKMIKSFEGLRLIAYKCPSGVWTIGYGHTGGVHCNMKITEETATEFLKRDIIRFENHVNSYNKIYHFTQNEFDALVSFAFNVGNINGLTKNGKRTKTEIAEKMLLYDKSNGQPLPGLTKRRKVEHDLFIENVSRETLKPIDEIVSEVIAGKWGDGNARKQALIKAGYDYDVIRYRVNKLKKDGAF